MFRYDADPNCPQNPVNLNVSPTANQCLTDVVQSGIATSVPVSIATVKDVFDKAVNAIREARKHAK